LPCPTPLNHDLFLRGSLPRDLREQLREAGRSKLSQLFCSTIRTISRERTAEETQAYMKSTPEELALAALRAQVAEGDTGSI
jgi:hypothetical protein